MARDVHHLRNGAIGEYRLSLGIPHRPPADSRDKQLRVKPPPNAQKWMADTV